MGLRLDRRLKPGKLIVRINNPGVRLLDLAILKTAIHLDTFDANVLVHCQEVKDT